MCAKAKQKTKKFEVSADQFRRFIRSLAERYPPSSDIRKNIDLFDNDESEAFFFYYHQIREEIHDMYMVMKGWFPPDREFLAIERNKRAHEEEE